VRKALVFIVLGVLLGSTIVSFNSYEKTLPGATFTQGQTPSLETTLPGATFTQGQTPSGAGEATATAAAASSSPVRQRSLMKALAPSFFLMDPETDKIKLPESINTVVIDIGARDSDYLHALAATLDPTVALLLFDPLPDSYIPVNQRAMTYALTESMSRWLSPLRSNQVFAVRAAVGPEETTSQFNIGSGPACSSMLGTHADNKFWCAQSKGKITVNVVTLESILDLIPDNIQDLHLKVDTEGYDLQVLRGARDSIKKFQTVIIECSEQDKSGKTLHYEGQCLKEDAQAYMEAFGFSTKWESQGVGLGNLFFYNTKLNRTIPQMLKHARITFRKWYLTLE
jgi:FkbM family methyltransferase